MSRIDRIETFLLESPIDHPFTWSQGRADKRISLICKITTDDGLTGWGEGGSAPSQSVIHDGFAPRLMGGNALNINLLWHDLYQSLYNNNATGGIGGDAISCVDIALWDLAGKSFGKSIAQMLGGAVRDKVPVYATGLYYREDGSTEKLLAEAVSYVESGYKGMKTKVGGLTVAADVSRVAAIRQVIGDGIYLMVDANQAYNAATAIEIGRRLADQNIHWFEEPVAASDVEAYLQVKQNQPLALAGGECLRGRFEVREILERRAIRYLQPDVTFTGGITEFRNVAAMANAYGVQVCPHVWGSPIMVSASISLAATLPPCPYCRDPKPFEQDPVMEFDQTPNPIRSELASTAFEQRNGFVAVPDGPGLGIEIDEQVLKRFCVRHLAN